MSIEIKKMNGRNRKITNDSYTYIDGNDEIREIMKDKNFFGITVRNTKLYIRINTNKLSWCEINRIL